MTNRVFAVVLLSAMLGVSAAGRAEAQIGPEAGVSVCVPLRSGGSTVELQADVSAPLSDAWAAGAFISASRTAAPYAREIRGEYGMVFRRYLTPAAPTSAFFSVGLSPVCALSGARRPITNTTSSAVPACLICTRSHA